MPTPSDLLIREASLADAESIAAIYSWYVTTTVASFEMDSVTSEEMTARMTEVMGLGHPWLIAEADGRVVGYAYATQFRPRAAYRRTAEVTIYLAPTAIRGGIGTTLYSSLLPRVRTLGFHTAIATIALPNEASVALHESFGFKPVGRLIEVGYKYDRWIDVGNWQLMLE